MIRAVVICVVALFAAVGMPAHAQMRFSAPAIPGVWNPVIGTGGVYLIERAGAKKSEIEMVIVGTETVDDKTGYWLEMSTIDPRSGSPTHMKQLMVRDGDHTEIKRSIVQFPGQPALELPAMGGPRPEPAQAADVRKGAERVGAEDVTTPAGTFASEHYRTADGATDVWVSDKVAPWGLVKMTGSKTTITLLRLVTGGATKITGTPQPFDPAEMMRRRQRQ